jgi:hypothetical protein
MHVESMPAIHADRNLLVEPRSNLVDSAIKRTQEGGAVTMELKMTLAGRRSAFPTQVQVFRSPSVSWCCNAFTGARLHNIFPVPA